MGERVAYLVNQYPKVSHSFIRREILALERLGLEVQRIALQGWEGELADEADREERQRTRYVLKGGFAALLWAALCALVRAPGRFLASLALALRMSRRSERRLPYHFAYLAEACRMLPWMRRLGVGHLHAHFGTNSAEVAMLAHALGGPPYSFTVHGTEVFDKPEFLGIGEKVRRAAFVVATSSYGRGQIYRWSERSQWPKVRLVHCGLEPAFHDVPTAPPPAAPRIVCVGRLSEEKGQLLLIEATRRVIEAGVPLELVLAGDGELRPAVDQLVTRLGMSGVVRITGWISGQRVREEILAARALVLPSFAEGLPVVLMEAMALRRPVLATFVGGVPELVVPGENGWLFAAGSVEALAAALEDCLRTPPEQLRSMGEAARRRVLERHSIDTEARKLAALFRTGGDAAA
jgi:glycosyltransferase involved in cell wall biosynthesis